MKLIQLIAEWRARLRRIVALRDDLDRGHSWLWDIRARILRFLISRYEAAPAISGELSVRIEFPEPAPPATFCIVASADGPPPRSADAIALLLHDIHVCNRPRRRPWLWGRRS